MSSYHEEYLSYNFSGENFSPESYNGTAEKLSDGRYLISVRNIPAHLLDDQFNVQIGDSMNSMVRLNLRALSYAYDVLINGSYPDDMKYAMLSLIKYRDAVYSYRDNPFW